MYVLMRKRLTLFLFIHLLEKENNSTSSNKYPVPCIVVGEVRSNGAIKNNKAAFGADPIRTSKSSCVFVLLFLSFFFPLYRIAL